MQLDEDGRLGCLGPNFVSLETRQQVGFLPQEIVLADDALCPSFSKLLLELLQELGVRLQHRDEFVNRLAVFQHRPCQIP